MALAVLYLADDERPERRPTTAEELAAVQIANRYVASRYPQSSALSRPAAITERRGQWEVTYPLPPHLMGGGPVITIDKGSRAIVASRHQQ